jgi:hypothetical protein
MATSFIILHRSQNKNFLHNPYASIFLSSRIEWHFLNQLLLKAMFPYSTKQKQMAVFQGSPKSSSRLPRSTTKDCR